MTVHKKPSESQKKSGSDRHDTPEDIMLDLINHLEWARDLDVVGYKPAGESAIVHSMQPEISSSAEKEGFTSLKALEVHLDGCERCALSKKRNSIVFGEGDPHAALCLVGEGPGEEEDRQGKPFVGAAGKLLDKILAAMSLSRKEVYICNVVKCRPPGNRNPEQDEMDACGPFLMDQLRIISPKIVLAMGGTAAHYLLKNKSPVSRLRGRFHDFEGMKLRVTYHPAYLLRSPGEKRKAWEDVQAVMKEMGLRRPEGI